MNLVPSLELWNQVEQRLKQLRVRSHPERIYFANELIFGGSILLRQRRRRSKKYRSMFLSPDRWTLDKVRKKLEEKW